MSGPITDLAAAAQDAYERKGSAPALVFEGTTFTGAQLHERAVRVAGGLREVGVRPGDRVAVLMLNHPDVIVTYHAIWRCGAVVTPILFLQTPPELRHILTDSQVRAIVVSPELLEVLAASVQGLDVHVLVAGSLPASAQEQALGATAMRTLDELAQAPAEPLPAVPGDSLAALLYTGGTTGRAKGVMLSHRGLLATGQGLVHVGEQMAADRALLPLPLSHAYGLNVVVGEMLRPTAGLNVLQSWFDAPGWLRLVQEHAVQTSALVPSMMTMLLAEPLDDYDLSSLRWLGCGGAPLAPALREEVQRRLEVEVVEGYGCTESSSAATAATPGASRAGTVGKALPHAQISVVDADDRPLPPGEIGEICIAGDGVMMGYWNEPELTAHTLRNGLLHTGDLGVLDADGYLSVVDRTKDLIIRGGFNVYPRDVEDVLATHPQVASAAVVGRPDPLHGEEVVAVVALRAGANVSGAELSQYARERLARYKYPREVHVVDAVPVTSVGKTDRKAVRAMVQQAATGTSS